ncbi:hypothetical protein [uncultured Psychrobacter sp.]|uniref:hypothetical protein n=1 Tax=uncultured Psychrobacter sp. TaxID=259303 RepID=UPI002597334E|nr:hypothetical protein [uncultured Psychrobacter sp.]
MTNNIKTNLRPYHGSNYDCEYSNSSLNSNNLSLIANISSSVAQVKRSVKEHASLSISFSDVTPVITHLFDFSDSEKQGFTIHDNKRYYRVLSKNVSGQASRYSLAFFVPDNSAVSQAVTMPSSTTLRAYLSASRGHSLISIASHLLTDYDGLTLQNKRAERRICRAVTNVTESKTRHPILLSYSVALTQKTLGGYHA